MTYLLDTNVISEVSKPRPDDNVLCWLQDATGNVCTCSVVVEEMYYGILLLPDGKRKYDLRRHTDSLVADLLDRVLPFDMRSAYACAQLQAKAHASGRTPALEDVMIAAIAQRNNCILATRNVKDFDYLGVETVNPFDYIPPEMKKQGTAADGLDGTGAVDAPRGADAAGPADG